MTMLYMRVKGKPVGPRALAPEKAKDMLDKGQVDSTCEVSEDGVRWVGISTHFGVLPPLDAVPANGGTQPPGDRIGGTGTRRGRKSWMAATLVTLVVGVAIATYWGVESSRRNDPLYTLRVVDAVNTEADLAREKEYFTEKGYGLAQWLVSQSTSPEQAPIDFTYGTPRVTGGDCDVWGTSGDTRIKLHLVMEERWRFDDIYLEAIEGQKVNLWATYVRDHPIKAILRVAWPDILKAFLQGFSAGLAGA